MISFPPLLTRTQANADPSVISLMARANPQHIKDVARLNNTDAAGLRGMLAHLEAMQAQVKELLMYRGEIPSSPATPPAVPEDRSSRPSTGGRAFDALVGELPGDDRLEAAAAAATGVAESKELPSPPATDLPDEKAQHGDEAQDTIAVATSSPPAEVNGDEIDVE